MKPFEDVVDFMDRSRIKKVLSDRHKCYKSHIEMFWNNARFDDGTKEIVSTLKIKDDKCKDIDIEEKLMFGMFVSEKLVKGFWMRMGYDGYVNDTTYNKSKFLRPYKFLVHSTIHALHHRKGAFDVSSDFVMCVLTSLILYCSFNISQAIFNYMVDNINGEKFR
ncbi:hypothetical protein Hanom_Chr10g00927601 [Helianthus anomalus]